MRDAFHEREQAEENAYFAQRDAKLIEKLRARAALGEIAAALADKLRVDEPHLLARIAGLGVTRETAAAFLLAPFVEVAWADGHVSPGEYDAVVRLAADRGVAHDSLDMTQLRMWLHSRPSHALVEAALDAIRLGLSVLPPDERQERVAKVMRVCETVARAAAGVDRAPSLDGSVSAQEWSVLGRIRARLTVA